MARDPNNFTHNTQLSSTAQTLVSSSVSGAKSLVRVLSFRNTGSTTRTVTVYIVESSGTAGTGNELAKKAIPGDKEWNCVLCQGRVIQSGMTLQAKQDSGTDVNVNCDGSTVT